MYKKKFKILQYLNIRGYQFMFSSCYISKIEKCNFCNKDKKVVYLGRDDADFDIRYTLKICNDCFFILKNE